MGCKGSKVRILSLRPNYRSVSSIKPCHRRAFLLSKNRLCATSLRSLKPFSFAEGAVGSLAASLSPVHGSSFRADPRARSMRRHTLRFVPPACPSLPNGWPAARGRKSSCRRRPLDCNGSACGDGACLQRDEKTSLSQPRTACRPFWGFVHGDTPRGAKPCRHPTGSLRAGPGLVRRLLRARSPASGAVALHSLRVVQDGLRLVRMRFRIAARVWPPGRRRGGHAGRAQALRQGGACGAWLLVRGEASAWWSGSGEPRDPCPHGGTFMAVHAGRRTAIALHQTCMGFLAPSKGKLDESQGDDDKRIYSEGVPPSVLRWRQLNHWPGLARAADGSGIVSGAAVCVSV